MKPIAISAVILAALALGACATNGNAGETASASARDESAPLKIRRLGVVAQIDDARSRTELPDADGEGEADLTAAVDRIDFPTKAGRRLNRALGEVFEARVYNVTEDVTDFDPVTEAFAARKLDAVLLVTFRPGVYRLQVKNEAGELVTPEGAEHVYDIAGVVTAKLYAEDYSLLFSDRYLVDFGAREMPSDAAAIEATLADAFTDGDDALRQTYAQIVNGVVYGQKGDDYVSSQFAKNTPWSQYGQDSRREVLSFRLHLGIN